MFTALLVLVVSSVAFAGKSGIGNPPKSTDVDVLINVEPWVRVNTAVDFVELNFTPGESGASADFIASVKGNTNYVVRGEFVKNTDDGFKLDFSFADENGDLPGVNNGRFKTTPIYSRVINVEDTAVEENLPVRVAAHKFDPAAVEGHFAGTLRITVSADLAMPQ